MTDDDLFEVDDQHLPARRERLFPPTTALSMFMAQTLNFDSSCQATIDRHAVDRVANDLRPCSTATGAYGRARQRLPAAMVQALLRHTGTLLASQALDAWRWHGRAVKLVDGTTITMPDTVENQARYPQSRTQNPGLGFPISRVVALMCLGTGVEKRRPKPFPLLTQPRYLAREKVRRFGHPKKLKLSDIRVRFI